MFIKNYDTYYDTYFFIIPYYLFAFDGCNGLVNTIFNPIALVQTRG
jgi:hypothetical protein